ncbi:MAG: hypothetical protein BWX88_02022 [Planctomycetes bacterium ADurb.Bin126]|nr:MAG: hypothetical protein BWX88_02022 [Planctomycetes bacterium ADurb.Bin126]
MTLDSVIDRLASLGDPPRASEGRSSQYKPLPEQKIRNSCEPRELLLLPCACAGARARTVAPGAGASQSSRSSHPVPSLKVTVLRHCRCLDCRKWVAADRACRAGIGGVKVTWGTGERVCDPPPDAWQYCAGYNGPQVSPDVWVWPHTEGVEMVSAYPADDSVPSDPAATTQPQSIPEELRGVFEERAAIREFDANMPREQAEAMTRANVLKQIGTARGTDKGDAGDR